MAMIALSLAAVLWLGHGVRALGLDNEGTAALEGSGRPPDAAAARRARSLFRDAARANADPAPRLNEASLLIALGRHRQAARMLEQIARTNPGSIRAWGLLAVATARFDDARSLEANGELLKLYGRIQGQPLASGSIRAPDGRRFTLVPTMGLDGKVDASEVSGDRARFAGWAADVRGRRPAEVVVVVSHGRVVGTVSPTQLRPDLAKGGPALRAGFSAVVPVRRLRDRGGAIDVHLFAAAGGVASPITFNCASKLQELAC